MRHTVKAASIMSVAALALTACGSSDSGGDATSGEGSDVKACLAYDVGGRGDQSFNDSAAKGLDQAKEELGVEIEPAALELLTVMQRTDGTDTPREQRVDWFWACRSWAGEPRICEPGKAPHLE